MNLQRVSSVFQIVFNRPDDRRQFFGLAHRDETSAEGMGHGRSKEIPARFDSHNHVNCRTPIVVAKRVNGLPKAFLVFQQGRNIVKIDARFREIRHFTD